MTTSSELTKRSLLDISFAKSRAQRVGEASPFINDNSLQIAVILDGLTTDERERLLERVAEAIKPVLQYESKRIFAQLAAELEMHVAELKSAAR